MDSSVDDELIEILENISLSPDTRSQGWEYVLSLTASEDGLNHIVHSKKYLPFIISYCFKEAEDKCLITAYKCLINVSTQEHGAYSILANRKDFCNYLLHSICNKNPKYVQSKCSLLANLSSYEEIAKNIIHMFKDSKDLLKKVVEAYCTSELKTRSHYDFMTLVFANISRQADGRNLFLKDSEFITRILDFTKPSESESRRLGTAFILRNCCMETDHHDKLLNDIKILPSLVLPLMTPKMYEEGGEMGTLPSELQQRCLKEVKDWDPSPSVRRVLVQALIVLCYSEIGWSCLKSNGVYYVVRDLHSWEGIDSETAELINQLVAYFLVVKYTRPTCSVSFSIKDSDMIKELEKDMSETLPDFVM